LALNKCRLRLFRSGFLKCTTRKIPRVSYPARTLQPSICVNVRHVRARGYACGT